MPYLYKLEFLFQKNDIIIEGYDGDYDGKTHFVNVSNYKPGTEVLYSLDNENWSTNRPERIDVGDNTL